jgi:hypothetical protein
MSWRSFLGPGGGCQIVAPIFSDWQRLPILGDEFLRPATLASLWRSPPRIGERCQSPESNATDWQSLPVSQIQCHGLAGVARRKNPSPIFGDDRSPLESAAAPGIAAYFR